MVFTLFVPPLEREPEVREEEEEELDDRPPELDDELEDELEEPPEDEDELDVEPPELDEVPPPDELLVLPVIDVVGKIDSVQHHITYHPCLCHHHLCVGRVFFVRFRQRTTKALEST